MSSPSKTSNSGLQPLDLSGWRNAPTILMAVGGLGVVAGFFVNQRQLGFSWLLAYMFFLCLCVGSWALVMLHHLFDASWSVPIRRVCEQMSCLLPWMTVLFIPIALLAPKMYEWMILVNEKHPDHAIRAKFPLFTIPGFYISAAFCFIVWLYFPRRLRYWSLKQDETGAVECTYKMRQLSCLGMVFFALSVTLAAIMWIKALQHEWFSTMFGVWYFAASMWTTLATVYVLIRLLERQGPLRGVVHEKTYYFIGSILFAFTVFYAYVTFAQYFIIWNANMPEETFFYLLRERGNWWGVGMIIIFGHFFLPFLLLLRIDWKLKLPMMFFLFVWAWLMNFTDMSFNITPSVNPLGSPWLHWMDLASLAFIGGFLAKIFVKNLYSSPMVPQKDPRFAESQEIYVEAEVRGAAAKSGGGR